MTSGYSTTGIEYCKKNLHNFIYLKALSMQTCYRKRVWPIIRPLADLVEEHRSVTEERGSNRESSVCPAQLSRRRSWSS